MKLPEIYVLVVGGAGVVALAYYLPGIWRHTNRRLDGQPDLWPYGELGWRSFARCIIPIYGLWVLGYALVGLIVLTAHAPLPAWVAQSTAACAVVLLLLTVSVFLFNWPKIIVPPSMRDGPGVLVQLLTRRRNRQ